MVLTMQYIVALLRERLQEQHYKGVAIEENIFAVASIKIG